MDNNRLIKILPVLAVVLLVLSLIAIAFLVYQYRQTQQKLENLSSNPNAIAQMTQEDKQKLIKEVGKLIDLPTDEDPSVITVTDTSQLKDQPFFQKAKNGDKLLVYEKNKKAILYDPSIKKIIDVAPVNIASDSAQQSSSSATQGH